jgi:thymidylate synthase
MAIVDTVYRHLIASVLRNGEERPSRAGTTVGVFGAGIVIPMSIEFPLLTTRRLYPKGVIGELAGFLQGSILLKTFKDFGCNYWDANAAAWPANEGLPIEQHAVGRIYGTQWREWNGVYDQLKALVNGIKHDPYSRRHILTTWNPSELHEMCLPPCHLLAQFYVLKGRLSCLVYMRSVDLALGLPSDIILYGLLLSLVAQDCDLAVGNLQFTFGDAHIYADHEDLLVQQISREPKPGAVLQLAPTASTFTFTPSDVEILNYEPREPISYAFHV